MERYKVTKSFGAQGANEKFYKISMNGSYGYDGMNTEKYNKIKFCNKSKTYQAIISDTYLNGMNTEKYNKIKFCNKSKTYQAIISDTYLNARKIADNIYLVNQQPKN